jgi:hypothetical protein
MSYFKKIVDRTLNTDSGSLRPAITPDSIPELLETNAQHGKPARKIKAPSAPNASDEKQQPPADLPPRSGPEAKTLSEEDRPQEHAIDTTKAPEKNQTDAQGPASLEHKKTAQVTPEMPQTDSVPLILNPRVAKSAPEDAKVPAPRPDMIFDSERTEMLAKESLIISTDKEKPDIATPAAPRAAMKVGQAGNAFQIKRQERRDLATKDSPVPERYPHVRPAMRESADKYVSATPQPEETMVTINIGRIEVRAVTSGEPKSLPHKEFSPPLSLAEYLKQRTEGKKT